MKKNILYFIAVVLSLLITFVVFELMSWYHFGDIPTKVVLVRLIAFFLVVAGLLISIVAFINKKKIESALARELYVLFVNTEIFVKI